MSKCLSAEVIDFKACSIVGVSIEVEPQSPLIAKLWHDSMSNGIFELLQALPNKLSLDMIGSATHFKEKTFTYTMGYLCEKGTLSSDFNSIELNSCTVLHTKAQGKESEIYKDIYFLSMTKMEELNLKFDETNDFALEVYTQDFVNTSDDKEAIILDYIMPVLK